MINMNWLNWLLSILLFSYLTLSSVEGTHVGILFEFVFPGPTKLTEKQEQTTQLYGLKEKKKDKHVEFRACSLYSRR